MMSAVAESGGSAATPPLVASRAMRVNTTSAQSAAPRTATAPESRRMWLRSMGPASGGTGTTGTPAAKPAITAMTVSRVGVALTATTPPPTKRPAIAVARSVNSTRVIDSLATEIVVEGLVEAVVEARLTGALRRLCGRAASESCPSPWSVVGDRRSRRGPSPSP